MYLILIKQRCLEELKGEIVFPTTMSQENKTEMVDKAKNVIVFCLKDIALSENAKQTTAVAIWERLKLLYMNKSLANRQLL